MIGKSILFRCKEVNQEVNKYFYPRAHPKFMEKLFIQEVPEIYDGLIEIKSSARDPGSRANVLKLLIHP